MRPPISASQPLTRHIEQVIAARLLDEPVVAITGPRTVGKSTLLAAYARPRSIPIFDLDDLPTRDAVRADPGYYVKAGGPEPICIDEFQHVPELLDAIKAELNRDRRPGRFLITGSTSYSTLPATGQSLTGRVHLVTMWPFSQGELDGHRETFLDTLLTTPDQLRSTSLSSTQRAEYEDMVLRGGFPLPLERPTAEGRSRWYRDYLATVLDRDVLEIRKIRQRELFPQVVRRAVAQTAQVLVTTRIATDMRLQDQLIGDYIKLAEAVFLVHRLEAYGRTLATKVAHRPKVHVVDTGLGAHLLGITHDRLRKRDPAALTEFGHLVETFAINEVIKQSAWASTMVRFSHYRTREGAEVDLVAETDDGRVSGIEVKAAGVVSNGDLRGLRQLRDRVGNAFVGGVVLYLGSQSYLAEDRIYVVSLDRVWH